MSHSLWDLREKTQALHWSRKAAPWTQVPPAKQLKAALDNIRQLCLLYSKVCTLLGRLFFHSVQQAIEIYARACMSVSSLLGEQSLIRNLALLRNSHIQPRSSLIQWPSSPQCLAYVSYSSRQTMKFARRGGQYIGSMQGLMYVVFLSLNRLPPHLAEYPA